MCVCVCVCVCVCAGENQFFELYTQEARVDKCPEVSQTNAEDVQTSVVTLK